MPSADILRGRDVPDSESPNNADRPFSEGGDEITLDFVDILHSDDFKGALALIPNSQNNNPAVGIGKGADRLPKESGPLAPDPASSQFGIATLALARASTLPLTPPFISGCYPVSFYAGAR